jgi:hypothetical protein
MTIGIEYFPGGADHAGVACHKAAGSVARGRRQRPGAAAAVKARASTAKPAESSDTRAALGRVERSAHGLPLR